jgi:ComF family protein
VAGPSIASRNGPPRFETSRLARTTSQIAEGLFAVLFPSDCRICGVPLVKISRLPVCRECLDAIQPIEGGTCTICGERLFSSYALAGTEPQPRCGLCQRIEPPFVRALAYGSYEGGLRELIHLLKYGRVLPAANVLGRMLWEAIAALEPEMGSSVITVIPVPLSRTKFRQRGYNQAELIARAAMKINPAPDRFRPFANGLVRKRDTSSQTGLTAHQRRANLRGAFAVAQPEAVKEREVLVVDDVYTTGATASECARVLRRAGASKVWIATVARTLKISAQHVEVRDNNYASQEANAPAEVSLAKAVGI